MNGVTLWIAGRSVEEDDLLPGREDTVGVTAYKCSGVL
jgi:hypothetical protein